jgi:hypothetical protein
VELIKDIGAFAGLAAFLGLALLALLSFAHGRDIRRLREWAGSAPERDQERKEATSASAAGRAEEMRRLEEARNAERQLAELREQRRRRREAGLPELTRRERVGGWVSSHGGRGVSAHPLAIVAVFVAVVLVAGVAAYAALHGFGGGAQAGPGGHRAAAMRPQEVEVSVLNGTAVPGLAARFGDKVERGGFKLGAVTNSTSSYAESVVMFRRGHGREAHGVAKRLGIKRVRPITPDIDAVSAGAPVSVVVGQNDATAAG